MKTILLSIAVIAINYSGYTQGTLDATFGTGGIVQTKVGQNGYTEEYNGVQIQCDGKYIVAGYSGATTVSGQSVIARYNSGYTMPSDLTTSLSEVTITSNNASASYVWLDCNNAYATIPGQTSQSFTALTNGNYAVELTENGCVDTTECVAITTVGVIENSFDNQLLIYPNPTNGKFTIDLGKVYNKTEISIMDIDGKLIYSKITNQSKILNLSIEEPVGVYLISIKAANKQAVIRIVKE